jgi:cysteine-rich repeat protein
MQIYMHDMRATEAAAAARRRHMRGLLQDESVDEGGDGGNSSNTTAAQQGGDAPDEGEESIFVFTSWSAGSDFFELPASVAGGESARYCGDGVVDVHEECDDGTGNGPAFRCRSFALLLII